MDGKEHSTENRSRLEDVDRARRLFLYLRDLSELRSKSVKNVDDYESAFGRAEERKAVQTRLAEVQGKCWDLVKEELKRLGDS